ncbi:prominin-1-A-like [Arctopsyche grandis]|uniref:prominin-1-A-like n=1 Tax=Arctopsyche grandis TaxID=121162 RepID=UPI00406D8D2C
MACRGVGRGGGKWRSVCMMVSLVGVSLVAMGASPAVGSFTMKMMGISENLGKALQYVVEKADINYTEPNLNVTYVSSTHFKPMGMAHLYNLTNCFVDLIQKKQAYPEGLLEVHGGHIELAGDLTEEWQTIATHYAGIVAVVVIGVIFGVMLPIVGFCFCCCRCAGNCGARSQPFDKKHDKCRKHMLATLLICITTVFMLGLVCTFVTNERMQEGAYDLPNAARAGLYDTKKFLNVTHSHVDTLLRINYGELQNSLLTMLQTGGAKVSDQLTEFSKAVSVTTLNTMVKDLGKVKENLTNMRRVTNDLRTNASQLNDGLRRVKRELLHTLTTCEQKQCREILDKYKIGELDTSGIDFSQLPDVSELLSKVTALIDGNIQEEVKEGQKVFDNIKQSIENSVNEQIPKLKKAIENAGHEIQQFSTKLGKIVKDANSAIDKTEPHIEEAKKYIDTYTIYGWYVGLGLCCILLLILTCVVMGLLCGICGKRPDGYGDDCCNKGAGSKFLMLGVALMFLLGIVLIAMTLVYFLIGVVAQRAICDPLKNPQDDQLFKLIDEFVDLEQILFKGKAKNNFNMSFVVTSCHQNKTIYEVLKLEKIVDMKALRDKSEKELNDKIKEVHQSISFNQRDYVILKDSAKDKLNDLSDSGLSDFPFDRFTEVLVSNITSIDLSSLAKQLRDTANKISSRQDFASVTFNLRNQALHLETYQTNLVNPMIREAEMLNDTAIQLRDNLKFNHSSFKEAVINLVEETEEAERYLSDQGPEAIKNLTYIFATSIGSRVRTYLTRVTHHTLNEVGHCGPLSNTYNATLIATCSRILLPFNGFWFAAGCCIILFIPLIILSVKLATLYQKSDPYPGPLVESEYLYDAYADRDNIPLAKKEDLKRNSSNIEEKIRDFEARRGKSVSTDVAKYKQPTEVSKSPRTSFGRPIKFSFKSSYSSEFDGKIDDRTLPIGTKYSSKDECYIAIVPEDDVCPNDGNYSRHVSLDRKSKSNNKKDDENAARETAVCIIDSVLDSAKSIVETRLVEKPYKENISHNKKCVDNNKSLEKKISSLDRKETRKSDNVKNGLPIVNGEDSVIHQVSETKNDMTDNISQKNTKERTSSIVEIDSAIVSNGNH